MVVGFNHNVRYQENLFHVQTEDSGLKNPHIITLLYFGGTIIASQKTSYADIAKVDNLEAVVEDLMKEQHKEMLRRLKKGEFDENIRTLLAGRTLSAAPEASDAALPSAVGDPENRKSACEAKGREKRQEESPEGASAGPACGDSLDEIILSYLVDDE